jgi:flagellar hook-associated protein 2
VAGSTYLTGLTSGLDWQSIISQLMQINRQPETLLNNQKTKLSNQKSAWNDVNTKLSALQTKAKALSNLDDFNLYTSNSSITGSSKDVKDLLSFAVGTNASQGSYDLVVNNLAKAQKLASKSFGSISSALGISGDVIINGKVLTIESTDDLEDIRNKINSLNSGAIASIYSVATGEYRLSLTSQNTGASGIYLANGSEENVLTQLGIADGTTSLRKTITGGAQSAEFSSSTQSIASLLGLSSGESSNLLSIAGHTLSSTIDLSTDSLETIKNKINSEGISGVTASIVSSTEDGETTYRLQIDGATEYGDSKNIFQTLGILKQGTSDVSGLTGGQANTANGSVITKDTLLVDIDGYNTWTSGDKITISGKQHDGITDITPVEFTITSTSTVSDLLTAIEGAYGGSVSASVNGSGAIVVEDNQAGTSGLTMTLTSTVAASGSTLNFGTFAASTVRKREIVTGEDAQITLDGVTVTRKSNSINDVITGVTLNLVGEDEDAHVTLDITRDTEGLKAKISDFVTSYNDLMTYINTQFTYTASSSTSTSSSSTSSTQPILFADSSLQAVKDSIRKVILSGVSGIDSPLDHLSLIGINSDKTGLLSIDDNTLDGYLQTNFEDVMALFVAQGTSTSSALTYVSSGKNSLEGEYDVEITTAASQATTTGAGFSGTLDSDAVLSLTDKYGRVARMSLTAGANITSIINAINSEVAKQYQEVLVGANSLTDTSLAGAITEDSTWDHVSGSTLADGDTITFTGTNRSGTTITGSYTVSDISTGTVGDLLSAIDDAYGTGYNAYIDSQGRIAIKDKTTGDSQLSLSISSAKIDFGVIDADPTGADGSHEGRYAMDITASNEGGQLKITNNAYGSNSSLTLSVTGGNLGMTDGTYSGNDAGRIRKHGSTTWMTMTGLGQSLTGDKGQDVEGLVIKYIGTTIPGDYLDFTFTSGVGNKMNTILDAMTDSLTGYVASKQTTLQNQMDDIDQRISDMEVRLAKEEEMLMSKFVAMEAMLSQLQAQSSWLTSQIDSLSS